jgi:DNA topoisomerase IB
VGEPRGFGHGAVDVVGMDERQEGRRQQFVRRPSQRLLPGRVDAKETAAQIGDAQHVGREREELVEIFARVVEVLGALRQDSQRFFVLRRALPNPFLQLQMRLFDALGHGVERQAKASDLVAARDGDAS